MAYNEDLARRISEALQPHGKEITEKKMFGGVAFMYKGKMCCGVVKDELMLRVVSEKYGDALKQPHTRAMDFTGKPMKDFLYIEPEGFKSDKQLNEWIALGLEHAERASKR